MSKKEETKAGEIKKVPQSELRQYVYGEGVNVEIPGYFLTDLIMLIEQLVNSEVKTETDFKYNYVNAKGAIVKNVTKEDVEAGKYSKVVDIDRTINNPTFRHSITEKGVAYAQLKNFLEVIHYKNIENGVAKHYSEFAPKQPESDKQA